MDKSQIIRFTQGLTTLVTEGKKDMTRRLTTDRRQYEVGERVAIAEGYGEALISALKKLARENLSDLSPSPLLVKLEYSHPSLSQRIEAIEKALKK